MQDSEGCGLMKIKKGDILIGTCPYTGEKIKYKYLGDTDKDSMLYKNGFKRILIEKRKDKKNQKVIITDSHAKRLKLRKKDG